MAKNQLGPQTLEKQNALNKLLHDQAHVKLDIELKTYGFAKHYFPIFKYPGNLQGEINIPYGFKLRGYKVTSKYASCRIPRLTKKVVIAPDAVLKDVALLFLSKKHAISDRPKYKIYKSPQETTHDLDRVLKGAIQPIRLRAILKIAGYFIELDLNGKGPLFEADETKDRIIDLGYCWLIEPVLKKSKMFVISLERAKAQPDGKERTYRLIAELAPKVYEPGRIFVVPKKPTMKVKNK